MSSSSFRIPLVRPEYENDKLFNSFSKILESGTYTKGDFCSSFHSSLLRQTDSPFGYLTSSATTAIYTALHLLNVGQGDEVIVSDFSFPASANAVTAVGTTPVFADVSLSTFNSTSSQIEELITPNTKAIMFVDCFGNPSGLLDVLSLAAAYSLPLIEDAACALGSNIASRPCGSLSDFTCFSFHPRKIICAGEGGFISIKSHLDSQRAAIILNHGAAVGSSGSLEFIESGFNFRMSEMQAALGLNQMPHLSRIIDTRQKIHDYYTQSLSHHGFHPQSIDSNVSWNCQSLVFVVPGNISRDALISHLDSNHIDSCLGTYSQSSQPSYTSATGACLPNSHRLQSTTITLPCFSGLDPTYVVDTVLDFVSSA